MPSLNLESRFWSEDLWKLKKTEEFAWCLSPYSQACKNHNSVDFYRIASILEAQDHKFRYLQALFWFRVRTIFRRPSFLVYFAKWRCWTGKFEFKSRFTRKFITRSYLIRLRSFFYAKSPTQRSTTLLWSPSSDYAPINTSFLCKYVSESSTDAKYSAARFMLSDEYSKIHISLIFQRNELIFWHRVDIDVSYVFVSRPESKFRTELPANLLWTYRSLTG